jgi:adenine-specific DNA-methyltransferase
MSNMQNTNADAVISEIFHGAQQAALLQGDCFDLLSKLPSNSVDLIFSSPPYCIGKEYESTSDLKDFIITHSMLLPELVRILKPGGSMCWQVGMHVKNGVSTPLDSLVFSESLKHEDLLLRNRIIWTFGHGLHCSNRFSGRHETIMWFTKGKEYSFNLDAVRVPQKYPGKTSSRGTKKGQPSGNPLGKNPGDVWNIPNVKSRHVEKTEHPCQFPVALPQIFIRALTTPGDIVLDPFSGSGTTGVASLIEGRKYIGSEVEEKYNNIAEERLKQALTNSIKIRPWAKEVHTPKSNTKVATAPDGYATHDEISDYLIKTMESTFM